MRLKHARTGIAVLYDATLSEVTDRIIHKVKEWQNRPLESLYTIVWLDAIHYKVKDGGKVVCRAVYNVLAVNKESRKDLNGMYVSEKEGVNLWLSNLTNLKARGVKDILIASIDNLSGFSEAILSVFPNDKALLKLLYLATGNISKKWTQPLQNWAITVH